MGQFEPLSYAKGMDNHSSRVTMIAPNPIKE